jgi:hypothetical protein
MSQQNVEIVRLAYAAFSERDLEALAELTDPDWVFDFSRSIGPDKGVYRGHEQVFRFAATNADAFERFQLSPTEYTVGPGGRSPCGITSVPEAEAAAWNGNGSLTQAWSGSSAAQR